MSVSAVYTPPTSRAFSSASSYGAHASSRRDEKEVTVLGHDSGKNLASTHRYMELCSMSDGIADDMHKESLAGMSHDAQGRAFYPQ